MKTVILCLLAVLIYPGIEEEKEAISTTLNYYMEGGTNQDFETLKKAFHEEAIMTINKDDGLKQVNAREFFSKMSGDPLKRKCKIVNIDIAGKTAVARLKLEYDDKIFHDFMTLHKINGVWLIVNKSFSVEDK